MDPAQLKVLRDAFAATMKDPEFLADAKKAKLDVEPKTGEQLAALIQKLYSHAETADRQNRSHHQ